MKMASAGEIYVPKMSVGILVGKTVINISNQDIPVYFNGLIEITAINMFIGLPQDIYI
ncbi:hypothetical protein ACFLVS_06435 [Chloroflexota bacterium]